MELEKFGIFMQEQRKLKGLTQEQVGLKLNVTDKAISRWERGECYPEITQLKNIAKLYDLSIDELLSCKRLPKKMLKACDNCKNKKCIESNYSHLEHCINGYHWAKYGIIIASLLFISVAVYLLISIIGSLWANWRIPVIIGIVYIVIVIVLALFFSLKDIKIEFTNVNKKNKLD